MGKYFAVDNVEYICDTIDLDYNIDDIREMYPLTSYNYVWYNINRIKDATEKIVVYSPLKLIREAFGYSILDVSKFTSFSTSTISVWERIGVSYVNCDAHVIERYLSMLGLTREQFNMYITMSKQCHVSIDKLKSSLEVRNMIRRRIDEAKEHVRLYREKENTAVEEYVAERDILDQIDDYNKKFEPESVKVDEVCTDDDSAIFDTAEIFDALYGSVDFRTFCMVYMAFENINKVTIRDVLKAIYSNVKFEKYEDVWSVLNTYFC